MDIMDFGRALDAGLFGGVFGWVTAEFMKLGVVSSQFLENSDRDFLDSLGRELTVLMISEKSFRQT